MRLVSRIIAFSLCAFCAPFAAAQDDLNDPVIDLNRIWVFSVGIEKYNDPAFPTTRYCGDDAAGVAEIYRTIGGVPDRRINVFAGDATTAVNAETLRAAFAEFIEQLSVRDTLIVFFSGHGLLDQNGHYVLVTSDCKADNAVETGLSIDWLKEQLAKCRAAHKIVLLNACYSGAFAGGTARKVDPQAAVDSIKESPNTIAVSSSASDRVSFEIDEYKAGLFSHWLKVGLRGHANPRIDDAIDLDELFAYLARRIDAKTEALGLPNQTPVLSVTQLERFPRVVALKNPERPSMTVAPISNFPLPIDERTATNIFPAIEVTRRSKPRRCIGLLKHIVRRLGPDSPASKQAQELINVIDQSILNGETRLEPIGDDQD